MAENSNAFDNVLAWLHEGYPHGVPQTDYFALLALLARTLTEDEVVKAAQTVLKGTDSDTVTPGRFARRSRGHRQGTQSRGDPPGRGAPGVRRMAAGAPTGFS